MVYRWRHIIIIIIIIITVVVVVIIGIHVWSGHNDNQNMRLLSQCKKCLLSRWTINVAIAFALFTLAVLTRNYVEVVHRTRSYKNSLDHDQETASQLDVKDARDLSRDVDPTVRDNRQRAIHEDVPNEDRSKEDVGDKETLNATSLSSNSPPFVVILAQWRFGSTIIGELFNQNPDIFFLFEPLWLVDQLRREKKLPFHPFSKEVHDYSTRVMRDIGSCNLTSEFVRVSNMWGGLINNRAVCEVTKKQTGCKLPSADMINKLCSKFNGLKATKVIRADLQNIKPLVVDDNINVKIIHLVRDPRGAAASRIHYYFAEYWQDIVEAHRAEFPKYGRLAPIGLNNATARLKDCIPTMCKWMRETINDAAEKPDWLIGKYHLLRYEDFAEAPLKITEELYRFVGLPLPASVKDWVQKNTEVKHSAAGTFDVQKNSRETARKWLSDLSELEIQQVEDDCLDVMGVLGYERYATLKLSTR